MYIWIHIYIIVYIYIYTGIHIFAFFSKSQLDPNFTAENVYRANSIEDFQECYGIRFSEICSMANLTIKATVELTFENIFTRQSARRFYKTICNYFFPVVFTRPSVMIFFPVLLTRPSVSFFIQTMGWLRSVGSIKL